MKKYLSVMLLIFLLIVTVGCNRRERTLDNTLNQIESLGRTLKTFTAEVEQVSDWDGEITSASYNLWYSNGRYRMEWDENNQRQVEIYDGNNAWTYVEEDNTVYLIRDLEKEDIFAYLQNFRDRFTVTYKGSTDVEGRTAYILEGSIASASGYALTWWVDKETGFPFKTENRTNQWTATGYFRNFKINTELEEHLFNFVPPSGSNIIHIPNNQ
jgi:outer membrane lipoprotein-sorting protein